MKLILLGDINVFALSCELHKMYYGQFSSYNRNGSLNYGPTSYRSKKLIGHTTKPDFTFLFLWGH